MDYTLVLGILKWIAICLGGASAVWGLLARKPTVEDETGRKRLTPAGVITLTIVMVSVLVSAMSFGFETMARQDEQRVAEQKRIDEKDEKERAALAAAAKEQRQAAEQSVRDARLIATQAEARALRAEQRVTANDARLRDFALSEKVGKGAHDNLVRAERALTQLERVLQPLEELTVGVTWEIPGDAPGMAVATKRLAAAARLADKEARARWEGNSHVNWRPYVPMASFQFARSDAAYLRQDDRGEVNLFLNLANPAGEVAFFAEGVSEETAVARFSGAGTEERADLSFALRPNENLVEFMPATGAVRFTTWATVAPTDMGRTGAIVSLPDLDRARMLLAVRTSGRGRNNNGFIRPVEITVSSPSRGYAIPIQHVRRFENRDHPVFLTSLVRTGSR